MTKFILHGGHMKVDNESNINFFSEISKNIKNGGKILIICFAREVGEDKAVFERDKNNILKNAKNKELQAQMAHEDGFINQVKDSDAILIEGGNTEKLLGVLDKYPDFKNVLANKTVAGSSAGAQVLSKYFYYGDGDKYLEGLGLVPVKLICHYDGNEQIINKMNEYPKELELIVLKDYEYKTFEI